MRQVFQYTSKDKHEEDSEYGYYQNITTYVSEWLSGLRGTNSRSKIFSQGSSIERTNVDSNHNRFCQKNRATGLDEEGRRVNEWSGLGGGR